VLVPGQVPVAGAHATEHTDAGLAPTSVPIESVRDSVAGTEEVFTRST
jgi:hypothetical protein